MNTPFAMSATDLGHAIARREIDPVDLTQSFLDRIDAHKDKSRIYARVTPGLAMQQAHAARERALARHRLSLLDGVPISWKDLFDTAGYGTEAGSKLLLDRIPVRDAEVFKNATAAGLVCLGKVHMSELAFSGLGYNPSTATPPCVNDAGAVPGGSSSGSAASVAFDLAPASIGSDTGGSVRIPAAWNDLVGFKSTAGALSLNGVVPLCPKFDTVGPITRTVADAAALFTIMAGRAPIDLSASSLVGRRLAILKTTVFDDIRAAPQAAFEMAVEKMRSAGAVITEIEVPDITEALDLSPKLFAPEAYGIWKDVIETNPDAMYDQIRDRFRSGAQVDAPDYVAAWRQLEDIREIWHDVVAPFDAVLAPTAPNLPPNLERLRTEKDYYITENLLTLRNTRVGNLMGCCALTVPTGTPSCGIMLLGKPDGDAGLLRLGSAVEHALKN